MEDSASILGLLFRTFLLGIYPRDGKGALYKNIPETEELARLFLLTVLQLPKTKNEFFSRAQQLGSALESDSFSLKDFYWQHLFPVAQDPTGLKYIQEVPIIDVLDRLLATPVWHTVSGYLKKKESVLHEE